ncbi:LpxI family protein [Chelatococcus reniformis]|uniref:DUF1009 domain-containing protein n=1 Tax=Chelatococcus reniformis TaxID=1494448 RepID=A0A916UE68_9HYPH|nr:UDP-2,3-diacylglucosamine diphosphatase LpxI [Chelatococcus reniformis]GGC69488.1 hypothetical protein GCM10010994_30090 [Chelatococcus reniformis]
MSAADGGVAILAGGGALPRELADRLAVRGRAVRILALRGFADRGTLRRAECAFDIVDALGIIRRLHAWRPAAVVLVGVVHRPTPRALLGAVAAAYRNRDFLLPIMRAGDDRLLRTVVGLFEREGFTVEGIATLAPELLAGVGVFGRVEPTAASRAAIGLGVRCLTALSPFDVGQAAVVAGSRIAAVEGPEGTDAMIARAQRLGRTSRLHGGEGGPVLVKMAKAGQDLRVDLPAIGPDTVRRAARAGFSGIAVGAGATLVIDRATTIEEADRRGLFVVGVDTAQDVPGEMSE